jgi:protein O-mannosyl-transferase
MNESKPGAGPTPIPRRVFLLGFGLVVLTLILYWPVANFSFVVLDDNEYIYENPWITGGLSADNLKWAFTSTHASNWHPVTWITHLADYTCFKQFAGGHHLTNVALHALNVLLLFLLLRRLTGAVWPGALVAALFAWHPLHVESVAWVSERKDVLSTLFLLLTLFAYARYTNRPGVVRYLLALVLFALGLMAKPMLVTLPGLLLLFDYWPLKRFARARESGAPNWRVCFRLFMEKVPFFILSLVDCVLTVMAQESGDAIKSLYAVTPAQRVLNALVAYGTYLWKTIVPTNLCVFYPLPAKVSVLALALSALALAAFSYLAFRQRSRRPWLIVGWLWFLGTLVPVIGLVQVGNQAWADRYTYIPSIGLFLMLAWTLAEWSGWRPTIRKFAVATVGVALLACVVATRLQLNYWHDGIALFTRALAVTGSNAFSENNLAVALSLAGRKEEALPHYQAALRADPEYTRARYNFGIDLAALGRPDEAVEQFAEALKHDPRSVQLHNNIGVIRAQQGKLDEAAAHFREAIQLDPSYPKPFLNYGAMLQSQGQAGPAVTNYLAAIKAAPGSPEAYDKLAFLLAACPDPNWQNPVEAVRLARRANELSGNQMAEYLQTLARAWAAAGNFTNAIAVAETARRQAEFTLQPARAGTLENELAAYRAGKIIPVDWKQPASPRSKP